MSIEASHIHTVDVELTVTFTGFNFKSNRDGHSPSESTVMDCAMKEFVLIESVPLICNI